MKVKATEKVQKKYKKGLDNSLNICYNKDVKKTNNKFKKERGSRYDEQKNDKKRLVCNGNRSS